MSLYKCVVSEYGFHIAFKYLDYFTIGAALIGAASLAQHYQVTFRVLMGISVGLNTIMIPTYLTSVLPGAMGGPAGTLNQLFITIGILFGYLLGFSLIDSTSQDVAWRIVIGLPILPAFIRIIALEKVFR